MAGAKKALATAAMVVSFSMVGVQGARAAGGATLYEDDVHEEISEVSLKYEPASEPLHISVEWLSLGVGS